MVTVNDLIERLSQLIEEYVESTRFLILHRAHVAVAERFIENLKQLKHQHSNFQLMHVFMKLRRFAQYLHQQHSYELSRSLHNMMQTLLLMLPYEHKPHRDRSINTLQMIDLFIEYYLCIEIRLELERVAMNRVPHLFHQIDDLYLQVDKEIQQAVQSIRNYTIFVRHFYREENERALEYRELQQIMDRTCQANWRFVDIVLLGGSLAARLETHLHNVLEHLNSEFHYSKRYSISAKEALSLKNKHEWMVSHQRMKYAKGQSCMQLLSGLSPDFHQLIMPTLQIDSLLMLRVSQLISKALHQRITLFISDPLIDAPEKSLDSIQIVEQCMIKKIHFHLFDQPVVLKRPIMLKDLMAVHLERENLSLAIEYKHSHLMIDQQLPAPKLASLFRLFV